MDDRHSATVFGSEFRFVLKRWSIPRSQSTVCGLSDNVITFISTKRIIYRKTPSFLFSESVQLSESWGICLKLALFCFNGVGVIINTILSDKLCGHVDMFKFTKIWKSLIINLGMFC